MKDKILRKRQIGLLFGSFSPPHIGHISVAVQAINKFHLDEVRLVPAKQNPWKDKSVSYDIRLEMVEAATKDVPLVTYDASELSCKSGYTYDVVNYIKENAKENEEFVIITTQETIEEMPFFYKGAELLNENKFFVMEMPINIHSTDIRDMIKTGKIPLPYIDYKVLQIIVRKDLYK